MKDYLHTICTTFAKIVQNCTKIDKFDAKNEPKIRIKKKRHCNLSD